MDSASDFVLPFSNSRTADLSSAHSPSAHLVGICGAGMSALASMLLDLGWTLTGSDLQVDARLREAFRQRGVSVQQGHDSHNLPPQVRLLIHSAAIPADNPEREAARRRNIRELSYSQMVAELMQSRVGICIAGTHGKSTTAAMVAAILLESGSEPSACLGAEICGMGKSGWAGRGEPFVVESCEYRRSFLDFSPGFAAILNIEPDHFDCFANFGETCEAFSQFAQRVSPAGLLLVRGDCPAAIAASKTASARIETFSLSVDADWQVSNLRTTAGGSTFSVSYRGSRFAELSIRLPGRHNILNALAAVPLCHHRGISSAGIASGLAQFSGVRRRFEQKGTWRGVTLVDDYAHHPTEVRATLRAARDRFGRRPIWCVFQPHQISRTEALFGEFTESLGLADEVLLAPIYVAREVADGRSVSLAQELARSIVAAGGRARFCADLDRILATLDDEARPGDVVITMGAGDIDRVHHEFTRRIQRYRAS
jgi:UDP-N-acetylmuramate--alanine ligase